jgi:hypothetical protein
MRPLCALALVVLGCADGKSTVDVTVTTSGAMITGVDHLRVFVTNPQGMKSHELDVNVPATTLPPEVTFALRLPATVRGMTNVAVDAMAANQTTPIASAAGNVNVKPSTTATLTVTLTGTTPGMPRPPAQLVFSVQPSDTSIGAAIKPPVQVAVADVTGATVAGATNMVTLALGTNPSQATLGGTLTVAAVNGVATFSDLTLDSDGSGYTLVASADTLASATSSPFNVRAPVWVQATNGIFGGVVNRIVAAGTPTIFYAGTRDSGVFVSSNGGSTWSGAQSGLPLANGSNDYVAINALAVDPTNGMRCYAATDSGVWVTSNGGTSWSLAYDSSPSASWQAVAIDPAAPKHVYIGGGTILESTDGGMTFADDSAGISNRKITSLAVGGTSVLATVYLMVNDPNKGGVWRQPTTGGTWARDPGYPTSGLPGGYPQQVATPDGTRAFVAADEGSLYTTNGGATWSPPTGLPANSAGLSVAYDPTNAANAYLGNVAASANGDGVWFSNDSGATWNGFVDMLSTVKVTSIAIDPHAATSVFAATTSGIVKRTSNGQDFAANGGLTAMPVTALAVDGATGYAGATLASLFKTTDSAADWGPASGSGAGTITATSGVITSLALDPMTAGTLYAGQNATGVWKSSDGGNTWTNAGSSAAGLTDPSVTVVAIAPQNPMLVYAGTGNALFKSVNGGNAWMSGNLSGSPVSAIVFDPASSSTLYVAAGGAIQKTTTGGTSWAGTGPSPAPAAPFSGLALDGGNAMTLYAVTAAGAVYKSVDGAGTWSAAGSFGAPARALAAHPSKGGLVYAATAMGIYRTVDGAASWAPFNVGLGDRNAVSVTFDRANPTFVYVGTVGGGVYKAMP